VNSFKKSIPFFCLLVVLLVFCDQFLKLFVFLKQDGGFLSIKVTSFFNIIYLENNGIAFGFLSELGSVFKFFLTLFRLFAVVFIFFFFISLIKKKRVCLLGCVPFSLVLAGAIGNVIDSVFYSFVGMNLGPSGGLFQGRVIDMFSFSFFPPVFNLADAFVCVGLFLIFIFQTNIVLNKKTSIWVDFRGLFKR
tara:strand:- start:286 stop:861 length:576 start_codon:yes stop_codon:yes gene_type:complete